MTQHDFNIANAVGATFRADLNNALGAIQSSNSGSSDPSTLVAYQQFVNTSTNKLNIRNGANSANIEIGDVTQANLGLATKASPSFTGTVTSAGDISLSGTGKLKLPVGTTAERPTAATGDMRFNSSLTQFEGYDGSSWTQFGAGAPVGAVFCTAAASVPTGFLECNGAAVSRSTYANLFSVIASIYGSGDGSSTFNLPDLRGEFIRGFDNGRGIDNGRTHASAQSDQNKTHTHTASVTDSGHEHNVRAGTSGSGGGNVSDRDAGSPGSFRSGQIQSATTGISVSNASQGGTEVRVRNIAMIYIIKF